MLGTRIIPCLQLIDESLVKAFQFGKYSYIGDPCNTVRIFNELEVDELCFLDIRASKDGREPNLKILKEISDECFMPLSYGGGISSFVQAQKIFSIGIEKVILNTQAYLQPKLIQDIAYHYGNQAMVVSVDVRKHRDKYEIYIQDGSFKINEPLIPYLKKLESLGAGEIVITRVENEGTWNGFDLELTKSAVEAVHIPVIAHGGGGTYQHVKEVIDTCHVSGVALGSMLVFQKKGMGVLVNFDDKLREFSVIK